MSCRHIIEREIREHGPIRFSRYMELCLYHPQLGYYSRLTEQFGKSGDFYTSSDVHAVFGRLLTRQFEEMWRGLGCPARLQILELGPGRGWLARDVLHWSRKKFPNFYEAMQYTLVESSPALRKKLEERLSEPIAAGKAHITGDVVGEQNSCPRAGSPATIVFANEFFDALPVEVLSNHGELRVDWNAGRLQPEFVSASPAELDYLDRYAVQPQAGERVEVGLAAQSWMRRIADILGHGFLIIIDYGYVREELLAGRHCGTIMCYRQHTASRNPFEAPGEQDITAHVNFTALRAAGEAAGLTSLGLVTQAQFLMGIGEANQFADAFEDCRLSQERMKVALQLKQLVTPAGMGETFQVLVMVRHGERLQLSGLKFAR